MLAHPRYSILQAGTARLQSRPVPRRCRADLQNAVPLLCSGRIHQIVVKRIRAVCANSLLLAPPSTLDSISGSNSLQQQVHASQEEGTEFDWERQWWPLAFVEDLDPKVPTPVKLLGQSLVLWRDAKQQWCCFEDRCPHRLAPLSEGRIEPSDGTLMCSYHGWRFQGDGACTSIPQALDEKACATACANQRSCTSVRPAQVLQGKVWVWGRGGADAKKESQTVKPALIPQLYEQWPPRGHDGQEWIFFGAQYMRDLPYGWSTLIENLMDPSHIDFAHHGVIGSSSQPHNMTIQNDAPPDGLPWPQDSFRMAVTSFDFHAKRDITFKVLFAPPCHASWDTAAFQEGGPQGIMSFCAVPTAPGQCRFLFSILYPKYDMPWALRAMMAIMPRFHKHLAFTAKVLDGNSSILHAQEKIALERSASLTPDYRSLYYMPTQADRTWLSRRGAGGPVPIQERTTLLPEHELLNHYEQHVRHCPSCSSGLALLERARVLVATAGALCLLATCALLGRGAVLRSPGIIALTAGTAVMLLVWRGMGAYIQRFKSVPYDHQV